MVVSSSFTGADWVKQHGNGQEPPEINGEDIRTAPEQDVHRAITATPFIWRDPANLPPRRWIYGKHYIRQYVTCTMAPGGVGKTSLAIVEALAMASGKPLTWHAPSERARVWYWNGEDPREELDRRIMAAMLHYRLTPEDIDGYLFTDIGREMPIIIATQTRARARSSLSRGRCRDRRPSSATESTC